MTMKSKIKYNLDMKLLSTILLSLFALSSLTISASKQEIVKRTVTGHVYDAATGSPMVGVSVQAYNNINYAAMTGEDGKYEIKVPDFVLSLSFSAEGYGMVVSPLNPEINKVDVKMYSDAFTSLYGKQTKASKEKSINASSLNADISIDKQIQAGLNGDLRSITRSGQQGIGSMMLMNGINSLATNAQPLVVVDGVIMDLQYNRTTIHDGFYNNLLANISVADIEKVTVIKNGTALYGAKGGNGVLLIDTKRNKSMATKIDLDLSGSFEMMPSLSPMMDATDYRYYASELLGTTGTKLTEFKFLKSDPNYYYYKQYNNNTNWKNESYREAFSQVYGINVQGGDDIASYNLAVGYSDAESSLKFFDMDRFNLRLNSDIYLSNKLNVRFDASYSDVNRNLRDDGVNEDIENSTITSVGLLGLIKSPFLDPYQYDINGSRTAFLSDADDYLDEVIGSEASIANPTALLVYGDGKNKNVFGNRLITLSITPEYKFNRYLTLKEIFSYSLTNTNANYYTPLRGMPSLIIEDVATVENVAKAMASRGNIFSSDTRLIWNKKYFAHNFSAIGGVRYYRNTYAFNMIQGYNTGNDKTPNLNTSLSYKTSTGIDDKSVSLTYYAIGDYNYKEKYYLSAGLSMESSSRFGNDTDNGLNMFGVSWGLFPSVQGAWVVTSESFLKPNKFLNYLKINAGYDISGNDDIDCLASRTYFGAVRLLNTIGGLTLENIGNTSLQWETTKRLTAGFDMNLFENKLSLSYNLFNSKTDNLLTLKSLDYVGGVDRIWSNDGALSNSGYDFGLKYKVLNTKALKIEAGATLAHYDNKITALPNGEQEFFSEMYGATILSKVGSPVGLFYGYETNGVYSTTQEALNDGKFIVMKNGAKKYFGAGDMNFVTEDNSEVNESDRKVIGNPNPDFYGNIFTNISLNKFNLNAVFSYSLGNDIFNYQRMILEGGSNFYNQTTALNNRWTTEGQITDIPVITYKDPMGNSRFSDRWIEDGSYLRLKSLTLSYTLPLKSTYLQGFTIWGSANNIFTLTNYLGGDPDNSLSNNVLLQGIDRGLVPQSRSFAFGMKINI